MNDLEVPDSDLLWESLGNPNNPDLRVAWLPNTDDGWFCLALEIAPGKEFVCNELGFNCRFTVAAGTGVLKHDGKTKNYAPNRHYVAAKGSAFKIIQAWEQTRVAITWPPPLYVV